MTPSEEAISRLARTYHTRVRRAAGWFGAEGALLAETRFRRGQLRFTIFATTVRVQFEITGFSAAPMKFSLNHPEEWARDATPIDRVDATTVLAYARLPDSDRIRHWLRDAYHRALIDALRLGSEEYVHFYQNGLHVSVLPENAVPGLVERLQAIIAALPPDAPGDTLEGIDELPLPLRVLVPFFARWAISDDDERTKALSHASKRRQRELCDAVEPLLPQIGAYLASFGDRPLSPAAIRIANLAEAVTELRTREA